MYNNFLNAQYKSIPWITVIDSKKSWPSIWILAINHGNEKVWLSVFDKLIHDIDLSKNILKGKIYLIAVNLSAYQHFLRSGDISKYRFIDDNMNRIHGEPFKKNSYEFQRKKELEPILDELDIVLDIHSVSFWESFMCICSEESHRLAKKIFDTESILLETLDSSTALISYIASQWKTGFWLECGNHSSVSWYENGVKNVLNLLWYYGVVDKKYIETTKIFQQITYKFIEEIYPKSSSFQYTKKFANFTELLPWEIFWKDGDTIYKNLYDKSIYISFIKKKIIANDGCGFLLEKI